MQIRIHKGNEVYQFLSEAIKERLSRIEMIPRVVLTEEKETQKEPLKAPEPFEVKRIENMVKEEIPVYDISGGRKLEKSDVVQASTQQIPQIKDSLQKVVTSRVFGAETNDKSYKNEGIHANVIKAGEHILVERPAQLNLFEEKILSKDARNEYRIMGQIFDTYWLIAFQDKLLIIDQHAAHEKVKYERLVKELKEKQVSSQMLNPPLILSLTGKETQLLKDCMPHFETMGFEIEEFGSDAYAVRSMPVDLYGHNEKELFTEILDELSENPLKGTPDVILDKLASMACKAAVKGNNSMSTEEMESLIDELLTLDNPYHCPHGRPTIISMSKYEIEKKFKRII